MNDIDNGKWTGFQHLRTACQGQSLKRKIVRSLRSVHQSRVSAKDFLHSRSEGGLCIVTYHNIIDVQYSFLVRAPIALTERFI